MPKGVYDHKPHKGMFKKGVSPYNKGSTLTEEHKEKISKAHSGIKHTEESKEKMRLAQKLRFQQNTPWNKGLTGVMKAWNKGRNDLPRPSVETRMKMSEARKGEKNHKYIKDRTKLKKTESRLGNVQAIYWSRDVRHRDKRKCRMLNADCSGCLEVHHILPWRLHPELRYDINNGITLCHFHHPRKWSEEKRLAPIFQKIISQVNS